jgi:hypothetical protein
VFGEKAKLCRGGGSRQPAAVDAVLDPVAKSNNFGSFGALFPIDQA